MPRYLFSPTSLETIQRDVREYAFRNHIIRAWRGKTGPLREYLRDYRLGKVRLTPEHVQLLQKLIYGRIEKKQRGKRGKGAPRSIPTARVSD